MQRFRSGYLYVLFLTGFAFWVAAGCSVLDKSSDDDKSSESEEPTAEPEGSERNPQRDNAEPDEKTAESAVLAKSVDISKYKAFAIGGSGDGSALTARADGLALDETSAEASDENSGEASKKDADVLFGVDQEGGAEPVAIAKGGSRGRVSRVYDMSRYLILVTHQSYRITSDDKRCPQIVIEKKTGNLYCLASVLIRDLSDFLAANFAMKTVQEDDSGQLMTFLGIDNTEEARRGGGYPNLYRLNMKDDKLAVRKIHDSTGYIEDFVMNGSGEVLFKFYGDNTDGRRLRVSRPDGGFRPAGSGSHADCLSYDKVSDAEPFFYMGATAGADSELGSITVGDDVSRSSVFSIPGQQDDPEFGGMGDFRCRFPFPHPTGLYFVSTFTPRSESREDSKTALIRYQGDDESGSIIMLSQEMAKPTQVVKLGSRIAVAGKDELGNSLVVIYDPASGSRKTLIPPGMFVIRKLGRHAKEGKLHFTGRRLEDTALVSAVVNADAPPLEGPDDATTVKVKLPDVQQLIPLQ